MATTHRKHGKALDKKSRTRKLGKFRFRRASTTPAQAIPLTPAKENRVMPLVTDSVQFGRILPETRPSYYGGTRACVALGDTPPLVELAFVPGVKNKQVAGPAVRLCVGKKTFGTVIPVATPYEAKRVAEQFIECVSTTQDRKACAVKLGGTNAAMGGLKRRRRRR